MVIEVNHEQVRVIMNRDAEIPPDVERENHMVDWAASLHKNAALIAAAGVLAAEGSLDKAASVLWWAGFTVPVGYFPEDHEGESLDPGNEEALRLWVQQEAGRIRAAIQTAGFYLATTGRLMDDADPYLADAPARAHPPAPRGGLRVVSDPAEEGDAPKTS